MKTIGIIGGLGPESTVDYYRSIIAACRTSADDLSAPEMVIYSVNLPEVLALVAARDWERLTGLLADRLAALQRAGADFAVISANTPHVVFEALAARSPLPLLSIVEETCRAARAEGLTRVGLLGTRFTMQENFFRGPFNAAGIAVVVPDPAEQEYIHTKLMTEIELGIVRDETRCGLLAIIDRLQREERVDGIVLGCTELPLILDDGVDAGLPFLNTTAVHVAGIVRYCREA
ncbi:racemase [Geotalea uraniireducens]|uniref:Racemase n=1 Tax=Geotalea uraniireducens TaxID=351604 RepID=A0ABN6VNK0_9BACT|nr:amino acid racemase [Geotalea uraniireducens]BDV41824.1 racemase [Geotalea uraniireducens]